MADSLVGTRLGRFEVLAPLGRGGMGEVYLARDTQLGREVALKALPAGRAGDAEARARLLREARAAAALSHPRVATLFEAGEAGDQVYLVMELVRGQPLRAYLGQPLPEARVRAWAEQVAEALAAAHRQGVVHRDLKPDNVMVAEDGHLKLLDFGLAQLRQAAPGGPEEQTSPGRVAGSLGYMSPEQATGSPTDARTDVFAFGVLLYELLSGRRPFAHASLREAVDSVLRDAPPPLPGAPPDLERLCLACLAKPPGDRPADGAALLAALRSGEAPPPAPVAGGEPMAPTVVSGEAPRRRRWLAPVAGAALGLAAGLALWARSRPVGLLDLPAPEGVPAAALAAYRAGLAAARDASSRQAVEALGKAVELAPDFAQAQLQRAAAAWSSTDNRAAEARSALQAAARAHHRLGPRDQALLAALEPLLARTPPEAGEARRRLDQALERFPRDAQLHLLRARLMARTDPEAARAGAAQALALDPGYAAALELEADALATQGRTAEALAPLDRCLALAPDSADCLWARLGLDSWEGRCEQMERDARAWQAREPGPLSQLYLGSALLAAGRPRAAVEEAFAQATRAEAGTPESWVRTRLAIYDGRLDDAARLAEAERQAVANEPGLEAHSRPSSLLVGLYQEMGRDDLAADAAEQFLSRKDAWRAEERIAAEWDNEPRDRFALYRAGRLDRAAFEASRRAWLERWAQTGSSSPGELWLLAFGRTVEGPEEARAALKLLDRYGPLPAYRLYGLGFTDAAVVRRLAGQLDPALPVLAKAAASCRFMEDPLRAVRVAHQLGLAREAAGDRAGACAAYQRVLARWGRATPRSVTAEASRARLEALGCPAP